MEAMLALLDGRLADARAAIDDSEKQIRPTTSIGISTVIAIQRFMLAAEEGRAAELVPTLEGAQALFPANPALAALEGFANALSGRMDAARRSLATVKQHLPGLAYDRNRLPTLAMAAEVAFRVGDPDAAVALEPELAPFASLSAVAGNASLYLGSISHALGWIAAAQGRTHDAVEHFRAGLRAHEELRSPTWAKRSTAAIAEVTDGRVALLRA
jgi:ATP/maltotriose-dependent transcriptional regulator MalT